MSTKTSRKTTTTTTTSSTSSNVGEVSQTSHSRASTSKKSSTPQVSGTRASASKSQEDTSPLSPTKYNRIQEKAELASLNDRLACYIDRVRQLESENSRLTYEVHIHEEKLHREVTTLKGLYENELADARQLLDELSKEKARLEIDYRRTHEEKLELKSNLDAKTKDLGVAQSSLSAIESRFNDISLRFNQAQSEKKKLADEVKALEKEKKKIANQIEENKKMLEEETLNRVDLENAIQTLKEELSFKEQVHQQQLTELRSKRQVEISEIDGRLSQEYEEKLYQSLQELREQYDLDLNSNKEEVKLLYEEKIKGLANQLAHTSNAYSVASDEVRKMQGRTEALAKRIDELEVDNNNKSQSLRDLEKQMENDRSRFMYEFKTLDTELTRLRNEMARQLQDYQDLMDIKVALDLEISVYRKLLEGEEERLNITPVSSPLSQKRTSEPRVKRRKIALEEVDEESQYSLTSSSKGDIELAGVCSEGNYIKLKNKGSKELSLSNWQLICKAGDSSTVFKFARNIKLDSGSTVTIWSSDAPNHVHHPPQNITMKGQKWLTGDKVITTLINNQGEEVATAEQKKISKSSIILHQTRDVMSPRRSTTHSSQIFQGDQEQEKCCIM